MATALAPQWHVTMSDLKGKVDPDWCPGCGDFGVLAAVQKALVELQIPNHDVVTISGIGCSSNFPGFINTYGMHTLHGRALAVATASCLDIRSRSGPCHSRSRAGRSYPVRSCMRTQLSESHDRYSRPSRR